MQNICFTFVLWQWRVAHRLWIMTELECLPWQKNLKYTLKHLSFMLRWLRRLDLGTLISFLPKMCPPFLYWESHWADFPMISKIPARAGALQLWREPSKEVTWLAAKSSKSNLSSNTQEAKVGEGKKLHGLCKSKGETQVETLRMGWEGWPPDEEEDWEGNGKAELLVWSRESSERRTHGMWGGACQGGHISTVPPAPLKPEKQDAGKGWRCPS